MKNENDADNIGGPEPVILTVLEKKEKKVLAAIVVATGGLLAFAMLSAPTRVRGATRSSRLCWEERQQEIQQALDAQNGSDQGHSESR